MEIQCTSCKAQVPIEEESEFVQCAYCEAALYVDLSQSLLHYHMPAQIEERDLAPLIQRALSKLEIESNIEIVDVTLVFFPFWQFTVSADRTALIPAASPEVEDLNELALPSGKMTYCQPDFGDKRAVVEPTVLLDQAAAELMSRSKAPEDGTSPDACLNHLPFFHVAYQHKNQVYKAVVEGVSGAVYADEWPPAPQRQKDRVLGFVAASSFAVFFLEAYGIPFPYLLAAFAVTGVAAFYATRSLLQRMGW